MRGSLGPGEKRGGSRGWWHPRLPVTGEPPRSSVLQGAGGCTGRIAAGWVAPPGSSLSRLGRALLRGPGAAGPAPRVGEFPGSGRDADATCGIRVSELAPRARCTGAIPASGLMRAPPTSLCQGN